MNRNFLVFGSNKHKAPTVTADSIMFGPRWIDDEPIDSKVHSIPHVFFKDYIDQVKAKSILKTYIEKFKGRALPHILIHGNAGCGKTTLARTIAGEHNVPFVEIISKSIVDAQQLVTMIKNANGGIVFIDEVHGLKRDKAEVIYSMMLQRLVKGAKY